MKKLFFVSLCALTMLSCERDQSEIQAENEAANLSLKSKNADESITSKSADITVYRYYSNSLMKHYFGVNTGPVGNNSWVLEGPAFGLSESSNGFVYGLSLMVNSNNLDMVITRNPSERTSVEAQGYVFREVLGWPYQENQPGAVPVYRYYRSSTNGHFYTKNLAELGTGGNGWTYEGIAFYAK